MGNRTSTSIRTDSAHVDTRPPQRDAATRSCLAMFTTVAAARSVTPKDTARRKSLRNCGDVLTATVHTERACTVLARVTRTPESPSRSDLGCDKPDMCEQDSTFAECVVLCDVCQKYTILTDNETHHLYLNDCVPCGLRLLKCFTIKKR